MRALFVEGDPASSAQIKAALGDGGFVHERVGSREEALELAKLYDFDVIVLDAADPKRDGSEFVRKLRANAVNAPCLVLSGSAQREDRVDALIAGADDYVGKPFFKDELVARLKAIVRRSRGHAASVIRTGRMTVDLEARTVSIDGKPLPVTNKEYAILELLSLRKGMTLTKEMFLDHLYGGMDEPECKIIDVFICKLRKKIAAIASTAQEIETVWGRGYTLKETTMNGGLAEEATVFVLDRDEHERRVDALGELDRLLLTLLPE